MNAAELNGQQALEIANLKEKLERYKKCIDAIHNRIYCIGGPLNDNFHRYSNKQKTIFAGMINDICEAE